MCSNKRLRENINKLHAEGVLDANTVEEWTTFMAEQDKVDRAATQGTVQHLLYLAY